MLRDEVANTLRNESKPWRFFRNAIRFVRSSGGGVVTAALILRSKMNTGARSGEEWLSVDISFHEMLRDEVANTLREPTNQRQSDLMGIE